MNSLTPSGTSTCADVTFPDYLKVLIEIFVGLTQEVLERLVSLFPRVNSLTEESHRLAGYNRGMNDGESAGQPVMHFHCHLIPRYFGDMENPDVPPLNRLHLNGYISGIGVPDEEA